MGKKIISLLLLGFLLLSTCENAYASEINNDVDVFSEFATKCFNSDEFEVEDVNGNVLSESVKNYIYHLYEIDNYDEIKTYLLENHYALSYSNCEDSKARAYHAKNFTNEKYFLATDSKNKFTKEWTTILTSTFVYNGNTYEITSANSPTISIGTANFGAAFSPTLDEVSTSYSISSDKSSVKFSATYRMRATCGVSVGDLPVNFNYDFGKHTHSVSGVTP